MKIKQLTFILTGLALSFGSLISNAAIVISGDVTNGSGVLTITDDIIFDLEGGAGLNPNANPYAMLLHDWTTSFGAYGDGYSGPGGRHQLTGGLLQLTRAPTPFDTSTNDIFVVDDGTRSNELTSAPLFDGNFYNRGAVLFFSDTFQQVRQLGPAALGNGDRLIIGSGSWNMPTITMWDLYGSFSGDATLYRALGLNTQANNAIPVATTNIASVPVPAAAWFFMSALIGLAAKKQLTLRSY
jgi:hypothetical protein